MIVERIKFLVVFIFYFKILLVYELSFKQQEIDTFYNYFSASKLKEFTALFSETNTLNVYLKLNKLEF